MPFRSRFSRSTSSRERLGHPRWSPDSRIGTMRSRSAHVSRVRDRSSARPVMAGILRPKPPSPRTSGKCRWCDGQATDGVEREFSRSSDDHLTRVGHHDACSLSLRAPDFIPATTHTPKRLAAGSPSAKRRAGSSDRVRSSSRRGTSRVVGRRGCQPSPLFRSISGRPCNRCNARWPRCIERVRSRRLARKSGQ